MTNKQSFTPEDWTKILESVASSGVAVMRKLTMAAAFSATLLMPASAFAAHVHAHNNVHVNRNVHVDRNVHVNRNVHVTTNNLVVGRHYHGGVWYGTGRRYWHGQWYDYGVGACWLATPIGYVWTCG
jgi:hypothetical protein